MYTIYPHTVPNYPVYCYYIAGYPEGSKIF